MVCLYESGYMTHTHNLLTLLKVLIQQYRNVALEC